ncbi:MAG: hypothetical protein Fur0021_33900 [Candidatus Promineifilaceae bacterium]
MGSNPTVCTAAGGKPSVSPGCKKQMGGIGEATHLVGAYEYKARQTASTP